MSASTWTHEPTRADDTPVRPDPAARAGAPPLRGHPPSGTPSVAPGRRDRLVQVAPEPDPGSARCASRLVRSRGAGGERFAGLGDERLVHFRSDPHGTPDPYDIDREIEDIAALIDAVGGLAHLYGHSSGRRPGAPRRRGGSGRGPVRSPRPALLTRRRVLAGGGAGLRAARPVRGGRAWWAVRVRRS
jgi:hypothetical protein